MQADRMLNAARQSFKPAQRNVGIRVEVLASHSGAAKMTAPYLRQHGDARHDPANHPPEV